MFRLDEHPPEYLYVSAQPLTYTIKINFGSVVPEVSTNFKFEEEDSIVWINNVPFIWIDGVLHLAHKVAL
jgi:hypothetical protein